MLVIVSGASGAGKNTIINELLKIYPNMYFFKNATTRPVRVGEDSYYHFTREEFFKKLENDELVEHQEVHGYYYGVLKSELNKAVENPQNIYIRDIEVYGNRSVRAYLKGKCKVISIFVDAPDEILKQRLLSRGETEDRIAVRFSRTEHERTFKGEYDLCVENINLAATVSKIKVFIDKTIKSSK